MVDQSEGESPICPCRIFVCAHHIPDCPNDPHPPRRSEGASPTQNWPLCDYTNKPCLDAEQLCRCETCQLWGTTIKAWQVCERDALKATRQADWEAGREAAARRAEELRYD